MNDWLLATVLTLIFYGLWSWFPKLATGNLDPKSAWVWEVVGYLISSIIIFVALGIKPVFQARGALYSMLTGAAGALGTLFFFIAISKYKASIITTITALYPVIAIILSLLILKETITLKQAVGIALALTSIYFIS